MTPLFHLQPIDHSLVWAGVQGEISGKIPGYLRSLDPSGHVHPHSMDCNLVYPSRYHGVGQTKAIQTGIVLDKFFLKNGISN
jgi:hypothetical protein